MKHPAAVISAILAVIAAVLGFRVWRLGWRQAIGSLTALSVCLLLIAAILLLRTRLRQWVQGRAKASVATVQKQVAEQVLHEGTDKAQELLHRGTEAAKDAVESVGDELREDWERLTERAPSRAALPQAARCKSCGSFVRSGARFCDECGQPVASICPVCKRDVRSEAKFCDHCGSDLSKA